MGSRSPTRIHWLHLLAVLLSLTGLQTVRAAQEFLDPELAFRFNVREIDGRRVEIDFRVASGYYLYRDQFKFAANGATLGTPVIPAGKVKYDETFQKDVETFHDGVRIVLPIVEAASAFRLVVTNQGCADRGLCYPPQQRGVEMRLAAFGGDGMVRNLSAAEVTSLDPAAPAAAVGMSAASAETPPRSTESSNIDTALREGRLWPVVGVFFVAGMLLSLTPCVLPMLPILSSIIVGGGAPVSRGRGLTLAASYSLGMALVYTGFGVAAGLAGEGLAAALQNPWVLSLFATGLVALALSMFGVYNLQMPTGVACRLTAASQRLPAGRLASVFAMGGVSALIVSPCVAAPLAGALMYLSQSRDVMLGGSALFSMAAGMSVPLLLVGASAGALIPRVGGWMHEVKRFFGMLLLGVALWTVQSLLPASLAMALWGALAVCGAVLLMSHSRGHRTGWSKSLWRRTLASVLGICGLLQLVGAASGGSDPLQPLGHLAVRAGGEGAAAGLAFTPVRSVTELDAALRDPGRPVMVDFYADWCISCKEMERFTFADPQVQRRLAGALLLKADVTANSADDRALLKRFHLFGPPGTIFFDPHGREITEARVIGYQSATLFLRTLDDAGLR